MSATRTGKDLSARLSPSFEDYGGAAPSNYERYFVPAVAAPLALDLVDAASLLAANACSTSHAVPVSLRGLRPSVWAQRRSRQQT